jgi:hypothetical protein
MGIGVALGRTSGVGDQLGVNVKVGLGVFVGGTGVAWGPSWVHPATSATKRVSIDNSIMLRRIRLSPHKNDFQV